MTYYGATTRSNKYEEFFRRRARQESMPKRMFMLYFMIDGHASEWINRNYPRGGTGSADLNCLGGFGYDAVVRKMIRDGEITMTRPMGHPNHHGGNETINRTVVHVTDKGREVYRKWKQANGKKFEII